MTSIVSQRVWIAQLSFCTVSIRKWDSTSLHNSRNIGTKWCCRKEKHNTLEQGKKYGVIYGGMMLLMDFQDFY